MVSEPDESDVQFLNERLCFALYSCSKAVIGALTPYLTEAKITYPQYLVILSLLEHGNLSIGALGKILFLDSGTLTPVINRMVAHDLIEKNRSKEDERVVVVNLTPKGVSKSEAIARAQNNVSCDTALCPEDFKVFHDQLKQLNLRMRDL